MYFCTMKDVETSVQLLKLMFTDSFKGFFLQKKQMALGFFFMLIKVLPFEVLEK